MPIRWIVGELDPAREAVSHAAAATPRGDLVVVPAKDHFQTFASAAFADAVAEFLNDFTGELERQRGAAGPPAVRLRMRHPVRVAAHLLADENVPPG